MNQKPKSQFRVVDNEQEHARDTARRKVKQWRSDAEREKRQVANQDDSGAPSLRVDDVLRKSEPNHARK